MCGTGSGILLAFVHAREVGVSSRNLVSRTFPQFYRSMLTPMCRAGQITAQPAMILRCISLSWLFSLRL